MTKRKIRALLVEKGITLSEIAKEQQVSVAAVSLTASGQCVSIKLRNAIAAKLGTTADKLWSRAA
jgi:transcriptional regulator with XRE-family HTH domain